MTVVDEERLSNLYNSGGYERNTSNWEDNVSRYRAQAFIEALQRADLTEKVTSILDVGCGSGGVLAELANQLQFQGIHLEGIDISGRAIEIARALAKEKNVEHRIKYHVKSITEFPTTRDYTLISLIHVLEHCPDMLAMLGACTCRCKYVYINVPLEFNVLYSAMKSAPRKLYELYGHLHFFDEAFLLKWLDNNGFEVLASVYSADYRVPKSGVAYAAVRLLRRLSHWALGPLTTVHYLAGLSGGYLVKKRTACTARATEGL